MSENPGRGDFLDAATVLRKNKTVLEVRRKEIDSELTIYKNAEEALVVLAEADRIQGEVESKIMAARNTLAGLDVKVLAAEAASREALAGFAAEVEVAKRKTEGLLAREQDKQKSAAARIQSFDDKVAAAEKKADDRVKTLAEQIAEKETALAALRETIASLAKL
jgi:hypothetical protein